MSLPPDACDKALAAVDAGLDESLERLFALLSIPSVSTEAAYKADCARAAEWLVGELSGLGFDASARPTPGHPVVLGHARKGSGPNVLFYGHYDVQPVDPVELWNSDPFAPQIVEGPDGQKVIRARGASDDKGQVMTFIEACRAWKTVHGELPVGVTVMIEGEEEAGGENLPPFMQENRDELTADIALVCDTDMWDADTPAITSMLRGIVGEEIEITCANRDLHSGMYGNAARNPNQLLADIIASLRNLDGSVAIDGFYDDVHELAPEVRELWQNLDFSGEKYLGEVGLKIPAGEQNRSVMEQITSRPTCEINGIWGGYAGDGFKTVIPSKAGAKISFRLVADQDPIKIRDAFRAHVRERIPEDCSVKFKEHGANAAISVPLTGPFMTAARQALADEWETETVIQGSGGSIPVVGEFSRHLGMHSLLIGFAQNDDAIHSPNEKYNLKSFHKGIRSWVRILAAFAE